MKQVESLFLRSNETLYDVVERIQIGRVGMVLIVDEQSRLVGTVTDGDVRRAIPRWDRLR